MIHPAYAFILFMGYFAFNAWIVGMDLTTPAWVLLTYTIVSVALSGLMAFLFHVTRNEQPTGCTGNCNQGRNCTCQKQ